MSAAEVATLSPLGTVDFGSSVNAFDIGTAGILLAALDSATPTVAIGAFLGSSTDGTLAGSTVQLYGWDVFNNVEFPITVGASQQIFVQPIANIDFPTAHGFVGINQNLTPAYPLDVIGDTNVAGNFRINTFTVIPSTATGYHGTGAGDVKVQMSDGTGAPGNIAVYDANGGLTDGGPPGTGGIDFSSVFMLMGA